MSTITDTIMMIRPKNFGFNEETSKDNAFQNAEAQIDPESAKIKAIQEFDAMVGSLRSHGVQVIVIEDTDHPIKPDAVFPNNWISFHEDGLVVMYPMYAEKRRIERRRDIVQYLSQDYLVDRDYTFEHYEDEGLFLEGTGSMILDRTNKIVYASLSHRTDIQLLDKWCVLLDYEKVVFHGKDRNGNPIYHTNVLMALGEDFCVICLSSIPELEKPHVVKSLEETKKLIIDISFDQMEAFAGNMLQVKNKDGERFLVMSETAYKSLKPSQIATLKQKTEILHFPIPTIETLGGGSVRCMMAEVFLPMLKKK